MRVLKPILSWSCAGLLVIFLGFISLYPLGLFYAVRLPLFLLQSVPFGVSDPSRLEQNFRENRHALEAIVSTVRTHELTAAELGFWGLAVDEQPDLQDDGEFRRAMRQARIQKLDVISLDPLTIDLVTDETPTTMDSRLHGYIYTEDSDERNRDFYNGNNRLHRNWYLFETNL